MPSASVPPSVDALPREHGLDPDAWLSVTSWAVVLWSCAQLLLFSHGRDQAIFAVVATGILEGRMPYLDVWDFKPPGIYLVYALAQAVFGNTMLAPRLLEIAGLVAMVFGMRRLSETVFDNRHVGTVAGALATFIHAQLDFWHTGQPESFGGFLTVGALVLTTWALSRKRRYVFFAAVGLCFGAAFLLKPHLGAGAIVCAAYLARAEVLRTGRRISALGPVAVVGIVSFVPAALVVGWLAARGALPAAKWTFLEFIPGYTGVSATGKSAGALFYYGLEEAFFRFSAVAAFGVLAAAIMRPIPRREREGVFVVLGGSCVPVTGLAMQAKFFPYHYGATIPLICLLGGLGLYKLFRRCLVGGAGGVLAFAAFVVVAATMRVPVRDLGSTWERAALRTSYLLGVSNFSTRELLDRELYRVADYNLDANRRVAMEIRERTSPDAYVYVWGFEPGIYWLSQRRAPTRFIYNVPQRARWGREETRRELLDDLQRNPPEIVVVQHQDRFWWVTGDDYDSAEAMRAFPELRERLSQDYELDTSSEDFDLYQKKPPDAVTSGR